MREVKGTDITIKELKNCYFGHTDDITLDRDRIVSTIKVLDIYYSITEDNDAIILYPTNPDPLNDDISCKIGYIYKDTDSLTVWDFLTDFFEFEDVPMEDYTFYFED